VEAFEFPKGSINIASSITSSLLIENVACSVLTFFNDIYISFCTFGFLHFILYTYLFNYGDTRRIATMLIPGI